MIVMSDELMRLFKEMDGEYHQNYVSKDAEELLKECIDEAMEHLYPTIAKVIFNPPATIVYWSDSTKTVVKDTDGGWAKVNKAKSKKAKKAKLAEWKEAGIINAIAKKFYKNYQYELDKWIDELC